MSIKLDVAGTRISKFRLVIFKHIVGIAATVIGSNISVNIK